MGPWNKDQVFCMDKDQEEIIKNQDEINDDIDFIADIIVESFVVLSEE